MIVFGCGDAGISAGKSENVLQHEAMPLMAEVCEQELSQR